MVAKMREQLLTGEMVPEHLTTDPDHRLGQGLDVNPAKGEYYCEECHYRVTRNTQNHREYGHALTCSHSIYEGSGE